MSQSNDQDLVTISLQKLVKLSSSLQYKEQLKVHRADWLSYFRQLSEMILYMPLHTVLALHFRQLLEPLLKAVSQLWKSSKFQDFSHEEIKNIENILQSIYQNSFHCFMKYERKGYNELVADLIKHKVINPQGKKYMNTSTRTLVIRKMLERLYQLSKMRSSTQNSLQSRKELNKFIEKQLLVEDPVNFLEQIVLNWIKNRVQFLQNEPKEYICCRIHFEHLATSNMSGFTEAADQEFKDYRWPLENESIKFHLVKTIVGYLNTTGGIIYVGLKQDKSKMVEVKGIKLTKQQKVKFLKFIHDDILNQVYPKELERRESEEKKESEYRKRLMEELNREKKSGYEYRINKYISIDFLDVYKKENYLNVQDLYVVRIKIKVGDQRELYHVINKKNIPETFLREDKSVRKKTIADFYDLFYDRMNSKSKITEKSDKHAYCRFQPLEDIERLEKHSELKKTERQWQ